MNLSNAPFEPVGTPGMLPFSQAVRTGRLVMVSGQASVDETGQIVHGTFEEEMRRSMRNLEAVLAQAGLGLRQVAQVRAYVDNAADLATYNRLYREYFTAPHPARTTLIGCLGGVIKFEIDAVAVLPE